MSKTHEVMETEYLSSGEKKTERFLRNGLLHNENGPAVILYYHNGNVRRKEYYINDKHHNENGPAYISFRFNGKIRFEEHFLNGVRHRDDGPAYKFYDRTRMEFFLNGKLFSEEEYYSDRISLIRKVGSSIKDPIAKLNYYTKLLK